MPTAPPRICNRCRGTYTARRCPACRPAWQGAGSWQGGSTRRWRRLRDRKLTADPLCQWPGCRVLATEVDHLVNLAEGGARYDWSNLQSLCSDHHEVKTQAEAARARAAGAAASRPVGRR